MRYRLGLRRIALSCGLAVATMLHFGHLDATRYVLDLHTPGDTSSFHCFPSDIVLHIRESGSSHFLMYAGTPRALLWTLELGSDAGVRYGNMIRLVDVARGAGVKVFVLSRGGVCHPYLDAPTL